MPCIKIKQLDERVATMGVHMGGGLERRKLEPGEVVDIPESELLTDGRDLLTMLLDTDKVDISRANPTRPLDYDSATEAKLCSPGFKPHDPSEEVLAEKARAAVAERLAEVLAAAEKPATKKAKADKAPVEKAAPKTRSRRAVRRSQIEDSNIGKTATA